MPSFFGYRSFPFTSASKPPAAGQQSTSVASSNTSSPSKLSAANDPTSLSSKTPKFGPELYVEAAKMQESRGNIEGAILQFKKALDLAPNNLSVLLNFARLYDRQGQFGDAVQLYQRAIQADPKSATALNDLGLCYARQRKFDDSIASLQKAIQIQPEKKMYRNNLATVFVEAGRYDEALPQLIAAHGEAVAHYNLGYMLQQKGQIALAIDQMKRALELSPQFEEAATMLSNLSVPTQNFVNYSNPPREGDTASSPPDEWWRQRTAVQRRIPAQQQQGPYGDPRGVSPPTPPPTVLPQILPTQTVPTQTVPTQAAPPNVQQDTRSFQGSNQIFP